MTVETDKLPAFEKVLGQPLVKRLLTKFIKNQQLPEAFIFAGPGGLGKTTMALALARLINCSAAQDPQCQCRHCTRILQLQHPDLVMIAPSGYLDMIRVDEIRQLQDWANLPPIEATMKIALVRHAERMNLSAANSLLKLLEEPPSYLLHILITEHPYQLLPTIRSRCIPIHFNPLPQTMLEQWLQDEQKCSPAQASQLALLAQGRPGLALQILDSLKQKESPGSASPHTLIESALSSLHTQGFLYLFESVGRLLSLSREPEEIMEQLLIYFRTLLLKAVEQENQEKTTLYCHCVEEILRGSRLAQRKVHLELLLVVTLVRIGALLRGKGKAL